MWHIARRRTMKQTNAVPIQRNQAWELRQGVQRRHNQMSVHHDPVVPFLSIDTRQMHARAVPVHSPVPRHRPQRRESRPNFPHGLSPEHPS